jgi:hypothetical protein
MIRVYDFRCSNGHVVEHFIDHDCHAVQCPHCDQLALRMLPAPRSALDPISGHFPGATMGWERKRDEKMAAERKTMDNHGEYATGGKVGDAFGHLKK